MLAGFQTIGNSTLPPGTFTYQMDAQLQPSANRSLQALYSVENAPRSGIVDNQHVQSLASKLPINDWLNVDASYYERSNLRPGSYDQNQRIYNARVGAASAETFSAFVGTQVQQISDQLDSTNNYNAIGASAGLQLAPSDNLKIQSDLQVDYRDRAVLSDSIRSQAKFGTQWHPDPHLLLTGTGQWIYETGSGPVLVLDTTYDWTHGDWLSAQGNYQVQDLSEIFSNQLLKESKQEGTFSTRLNLPGAAKLTYQLQPRLSFLKDRPAPALDDRLVQQADLVLPTVLGRLSYRYRLSQEDQLDSSDPDLLRRKNRNDTQNHIYQNQSTWLGQSVDLRYENTIGNSMDLASTTPDVYSNAQSFEKNIQCAIRSSLGSGWQIENTLQDDRVQSISSSSNTDIDTLALKSELTARLGAAWTAKGSGTFNRIIDNTGASPETWTLSPRAELQFTPFSALSLRGSYAYTRSVLGTDVQSHVANLSLNADIPSSIARFAFRLQAEYQRSNSPAFETWDLFSSLTASF